MKAHQGKHAKGQATLIDETQRCPHCGRYVIAQDGICPACGEPLGVADAVDVLPQEPLPTEDAPREPDEAQTVTTAEDPDAAGASMSSAAPDTSPQTPAEVGEAEEIAAEDAAASENEPPAAALPESTEAAPTDEAPDEFEALPEKPDTLPDTLGTPGGALPPVVATPLGEQSTPPNAMPPLSAETTEAETGEHEAVPPLPQPAEMMQETQPNLAAPPQAAPSAYIIPPAPYTPPPLPTPAYAPAPYAYPAQPADPFAAAVAFLQQRVALYRQGGYHLLAHGPYEATLAYGKGLSVGAWMLALVSGVGLVWYLLILALSGFQLDEVTVWVERDGRVYEDGPGAAHVRAQRARTGRRWRTVGALIFALSLFTALVLSVFAGVVLSQERYQAALRQAYPAVTLFEERFSDTPASADDVQLAKDGAVAFGVVAVLTAVGLWGGATLFVVGTIHASAYRVRVPPLPGWA